MKSTTFKIMKEIRSNYHYPEDVREHLRNNNNSFLDIKDEQIEHEKALSLFDSK